MRVIFLMNTKSEASPDLFCFFLDSQIRNKQDYFECFSLIGGHSSCTLDYARNSRLAKLEEYMETYSAMVEYYDYKNLEIVEDMSVFHVKVITILGRLQAYAGTFIGKNTKEVLRFRELYNKVKKDKDKYISHIDFKLATDELNNREKLEYERKYRAMEIVLEGIINDKNI
jgi:hypothetical protein